MCGCLRDTEIKQCTITRQALEATIADQKKLWDRLPAFHQGPSECLNGFGLHPVSLEGHLKNIERLAVMQPLGMEELLPRPDERTLKPVGPPKASDFAFREDLADPLTCSHVVHSAVIERKVMTAFNALLHSIKEADKCRTNKV